VLEEEVTDPRECIPLNEPQGHEPPPLREQRGDEERDRNAGTREVQPARSPVYVFAEVKRIEIAERTIRLVFRHSIQLGSPSFRQVCHGARTRERIALSRLIPCAR